MSRKPPSPAAPKLHIVSPLKFDCLACGLCCQGIHVWLHPDERDRVRQLGADWGMPPVVEGGSLLFHDGRCRFMDDGGRCRVHARLGFAAKPLICRQYPIVLLRAEEGIRAGLDPGCYMTWKVWRTGADVKIESGAVERRLLDPALARQESGLLDLLEAEDLTVARFACLLAGQPPSRDGELPPRLAERIVERMRAAPLAELLAHPEAGRAMRTCLRPVLDAIPRWSVDVPPPWRGLPRELEALALETTRRMLWLRIGDTLPSPMHVAVLTTVGAIACGWADPRPEVFGQALAAWSRAIRALPIWQALVPEAGSLLWLARGVEPPAPR